MSAYPPLDESDFITEIDGEDVEAITIGDEDQYIVAYGHQPFEYMIESARKIIESWGDDPDDFGFGTDDGDVRWVWAERRTPESYGEWMIGWNDVNRYTDNSFPLTVLTLW